MLYQFTLSLVACTPHFCSSLGDGSLCSWSMKPVSWGQCGLFPNKVVLGVDLCDGSLKDMLKALALFCLNRRFPRAEVASQVVFS